MRSSKRFWKPFDLEFDKRAIRDVAKLGEEGRRLLEALREFAETGRGDIKLLRGTRPRAWRLREGRMRAAFIFKKGKIRILYVEMK
jgi:mRNA-degrading endonuclease RelE of RelBE toxin-antitoxin system